MVFATPINNVGVAITMFVSVFVFTVLRICNAQAAVPALYMLGDSLVDVGNNNYLPLSVAKANFPHNGVDFSNGKFTGRFSNGENATDFIAKKLSLPTSPPYLSLTGSTVPPITGVSFASGGSGILNETGQQYTLYGLGARKLVVTGAAAVGCCPSQRKSSRTGECNAEANYWSNKYNDGLKVMLQGLKSESLGLNFAYFDIYSAMINLFLTPETYGFTNIKEACCGLGYLNADVPCIPTSTYCLNRRNHVFWDLFHPTEVVASMFIDIMYNGTQHYMFPINLKQLADI